MFWAVRLVQCKNKLLLRNRWTDERAKYEISWPDWCWWVTSALLQASVSSSSSSLHKNRNKLTIVPQTQLPWQLRFNGNNILWKFRGQLYRRLVTSLKLWDDSWFVENLIEESLSQNFRNILLQSLDSKTQCICFRDQNSHSLKQVLLCNLVTVMEALRYRVNMDPSLDNMFWELSRVESNVLDPLMGK